MNQSEDSPVPAWRWAVWLIYQAAWTTALLVPVPNSGPFALEEFTVDRKFLFSKFVHLSAYALFAILTAWLRAPMKWRWLLMYLLMAHATVTELAQYLMGVRTGTLSDVGLDHAGIAIGALLSWRWWMAGEK